MSEFFYSADLPDQALDCSGVIFAPVMQLPSPLPVFDFSKTYDPTRTLETPFGVGKYDEVRPTMYTEPQFASQVRNIHMGIDLAAPVGTEVFAFYPGLIYAFGVNALPQDYGPTVITRHDVKGQCVYALYGHLSMDSLEKLEPGQIIEQGALIGRVGDNTENGGWNPHLHFQLSRIEPNGHDLPGAVSAVHRIWARRAFPDPRLVLGPLYA
jgi:murein DD-endopeptidase MepM/ murein hydrolase activator NlpD